MGRPILLFLVNGEPDSAMGIRARSFAKRLRSDFCVHIAYRSTHKIYAIFRFFWLLLLFTLALSDYATRRYLPSPTVWLP